MALTLTSLLSHWKSGLLQDDCIEGLMVKVTARHCYQMLFRRDRRSKSATFICMDSCACFICRSSSSNSLLNSSKFSHALHRFIHPCCCSFQFFPYVSQCLVDLLSELSQLILKGWVWNSLFWQFLQNYLKSLS